MTTTTSTAVASHALELKPDTELVFVLSKTPSTSDGRCTMTLSHPGTTDDYIAFKVKTTQPRRYLVRPNQGLVAPHGSETVSILVVDKEKQLLLQSYDRLGQSALDHSKDKFLVQSCAVSSQFSQKYVETRNGSTSSETNKDLAEALTAMWNAVTAGGSQTPVQHKKLYVRHQVAGTSTEGTNTTTSVSATTPRAATLAPKPHEMTTAMENMSSEQMFAEISTLRRKYDELVGFSVNLTAERDILNNTLEQTKRELNREMAARVALENKSGGGGGGGGSNLLRRNNNNAGAAKRSFTSTLMQLLVVAVACFLAGVRSAQTHQVDRLNNLPILGKWLLPPPIDAKYKTKKPYKK